jgi:hypothetical protein
MPLKIQMTNFIRNKKAVRLETKIKIFPLMGNSRRTASCANTQKREEKRNSSIHLTAHSH